MEPSRILLLATAFTFLGSLANAATLTATAFAGNCGFVDNGTVDTTTSELDETFRPSSPTAFTLSGDALAVRATNGSSFEPNCSTGSTSYATAGALGVEGLATTNKRGTQAIVSSSAHSTANNLFLVPVQGLSRADLLALHGTDIEISPNIRVTGSVNGIGPGGVAEIRADVHLEGQKSSGAATSTSPNTYIATNSPLASPPIVGGFSYDFARDTVLTLDPSLPFSLEITLFGEARTSNFGASFGEATYESFNSLSFVTGLPAFNLPEGYTIFSSQLNIFDNRWIDPRVEVAPPSTVPIPASGLFLLSVLGGVAALKRRTKRTEQPYDSRPLGTTGSNV